MRFISPKSPKRPLLHFTIAYVLGIWCALYLEVAVRWLLPLIISSLLLGLIFRKLLSLSRLPHCFFLAAFFFLTCCLTTLRFNFNAPEHLSNLVQNARESIELEGRVVGKPVFQAYAAQSQNNQVLRGTWRFEIAVSRARRLPEWQKAQGRVRVNLRGNSDLKIISGSIWYLPGVLLDRYRQQQAQEEWLWVLSEPDSQLTSEPVSQPYHPSASLRFFRRFSFQADSDGAAVKSPPPPYAIPAILQACRQRAGESLLQGLSSKPDTASVLRAMALGYGEELPLDLRRRFVVTGTYHLFAISGTHMALLAMLTALFLKSWRIPKTRWFPLAAPVLGIYTVMVGAPPSAVRGSLMAAFWLLGDFVGRRNDPPTALALAALLILLVSPSQLLAPGFILSFTAVIGLIWLMPFFRLPENADNLILPESYQTRWQKMGRSLWRTLWLCSLTSASVWLMTAPLTAYWFNVFSPLTVFANLLVVPMAGLVLGLAFCAILLGAVHPLLAVPLNWCNILPVKVMQIWLGFLQSLPFCQWTVKSPPLWVIFCWYAGLALLVWHKSLLPLVSKSLEKFFSFLAGGKKRPMVFPSFSVRILALLPGVLLLALWPCRSLQEGASERIHILNADGVPVVLGVESGWFKREKWLVNAGNRRNQGRLRNLLQSEGVNSVTVWLLSRMDAGHIGAISGLLATEELKIKQLAHPAGLNRYRVLKPIVESLRSEGTKISTITLFKEESIASSTTWRAFKPGDVPNLKFVIKQKERAISIMPQTGLKPASVELAGYRPAGTALEIYCLRHSFDTGDLSPDNLCLQPGAVLTLSRHKNFYRLRWSGY